MKTTCFTLLLSASTVASAADMPAACMPAYDAMMRLLDVPVHETVLSTKTPGSAPSQTEIFHSNGQMYIQVHGKWTKIAMSREERKEQTESTLKTDKSLACRVVKDDAIDGQSAILYEVHIDNEYGGSDQQIWIAKASGLPVHQKVKLGGENSSRSMDVRFDYKNVQPPAM